MKVNIKGLVFTGFAAAILSANAIAADNTVTSKSYVDNKFQVKSTEASIGSTNGSWVALDTEIGDGSDNTTAPTALAVKTYVDTQSTGAASNILASSPDATDTTHALTNAATTTALNGKQTKDTGSTYQVSKAGVWSDLSNAVNTGTYTTKSVDANGVVTIEANGTTDTTLDSAGETGKLPTAATVKTYVDSAISNAIDSALENSIDSANYVTATYEDGTTTIGLDTGQITNSTTFTDTGTRLTREQDVKGYADAKVSSNASISSTSTTTAPNESAVYSELAGKQTKSNATAGTYKVGHTGDTWATLSGQDYVYIDTTDTTAPKIDLADSRITSSSVLTSVSDKLTREQDVYGAIQAATNGNVIPAMPDSCSSTAPCVLTNDTSTGALVWVPIQQAETQNP